MVGGAVTCDFTLHLRESVTTLYDFGTAVGHFLLGSHNFMVTALGLCAKWPLGHRQP